MLGYKGTNPQIKRHMTLKSLQEHGLLPLELPEQATCWNSSRRKNKMVTGAHPFIAMGWDLRYKGRGQKTDSLWRKWTSVCPLAFWEAQI